jgi:hypothetical protein
MRVAALGLLATLAACGPTPSGGRCKDRLLPGDLVITEVFADFQAPSGGTDTGKEWFEIYNAADRPVDLGGLTISHAHAGANPKHHTMTDLALAPGQFFTLGNATQDQIPLYIDYGYGTDLGDLFNTEGGTLALSCGGDEIDAAGYAGIKPGHSRELTAAQPPDYTLNDDPLMWCQGNDSEFEPGNFGTPGTDNDCAPIIAGQCDDQGTSRDVVVPATGDLVITEVMASPSKVSDTVGEWFEAVALHDVDLNGVGLDRAGDSASPNVIDSAGCLRVTAGSRAVFARSSDMTLNGGVPAGAVVGTFTFSLVTGTTAGPGDVQILAGGSVIDAVSWTTSTNGRSHQLDPDVTDALSNDTASNFCDATMVYGLGDLGTPDAPNGPCALQPPAGMCNDVAAGNVIRAIVKPATGALVISEIMPNPKVEPKQEWFEITNRGTTVFDVNDLGLDRAGDTRAPDVIHSADCKSVAVGGYAVFARSSDPASNAMLPAPDATFGFSMINTGAGDVRVLDGTTVLDAVTWSSSTDGVSSQVKPASLTTTGNDAAASFCPAVAPYGDQTNKGTPRAANAC